MTAADLRVMADLLDQLAAGAFDVAVEFGGDLIIRAKPPEPLQGEALTDGTRFSDDTGRVEDESSDT
jgi:hypothetical protein